MEESFSGQQEGERILLVIRPHRLARLVGVLFLGGGSFLLTLVVWFFLSSRATSSEDALVTSGIIGLIAFVLLIWWQEFVLEKARGYITDRRFVRFKGTFPGFETKRTLFWNEVAKVKGYPPNLIFRLLKVGTLRLTPSVAPLQDIKISWVYSFEDVAKYIDTILFLHKNRPVELSHLRKFIEKPKGERW